jgi:hypothetical protein
VRLIFFNPQVDVRAQFVVNLAIHAGALEQIANSPEYAHCLPS